jgi:hypothetical protein
MVDTNVNADTGTETGAATGSSGSESSNENTNPLLPDLQKWKERARAAEQTNADNVAQASEEAKARELADAKTVQEVETLKDKWKAELAVGERKLAISRAAHTAGVHEAFIGISDDGTLDPDSVIKAAKIRQEEYNERIRTGQPTEPFNVATSPGNTGSKQWTREEIEALDPYDPKYPKDEIALAMKEGRIK